MSIDALRWARGLGLLLLLGPSALLGSGCGDDGSFPATAEGDADGDFISDLEEGAGSSPPRDTDGDGLPDFQDVDADDDGLLDGHEAGDLDLATSPLDTDGDGEDDYVDLDADGNGLFDWQEGGFVDTDADLRWDFQDLDDDDDGLSDRDELRGVLDLPIDTDGDGLPNYHDIDSDSDTILDGHERFVDSDADGLPDVDDLDSDNDGWRDAEEAGDADLRTIPVDTDEDGIADFVDRDSDGDGLPDAFEFQFMDGQPGRLDPAEQDSDGDGYSDLIEIAAGSLPTVAGDNPRTRRDFVFVVPFEQPPAPTVETLGFDTALGDVDVYFSLDTSCSMGEEFMALQASVPLMVELLSCSFEPRGDVACEGPCADGPCYDGTCASTCVSDGDCGRGYRCGETPVGEVCLKTCRTDGDCASGYGCEVELGFCQEQPRPTGCLTGLYTGVGQWSDLDTFENRLSPQPNPELTAMSLDGFGAGGGEVPYQAPACVADAANCINDDKNCATTGVGCAGFRPDAVRILVQITDADNQCGGNPRCLLFDADYTGAELRRRQIAFVGLFGTDDDSGDATTPESIAREIGIASRSVDDAGEPFVFPAVDAEVVERTVEAIRRFGRGGNFRITAEVVDEPDDVGDSRRFVERLAVNLDPSRPECTPVLLTEDADGDGFDDTFPRVRPGTPVCWDLTARQNDFVRPTREPQVFLARVVVRANGAKVDDRRVFFLVPPVIESEGPG